MAARKQRGSLIKPPSGARAVIGTALANQLYGLWLFGNNSQFVEDAGPYGLYGGANSGGAGNTSAGGKFGRTINFDGTSVCGYLVDSVIHPRAAAFVPPFSVSAWVNNTASVTGSIVAGSTAADLEFRVTTTQKIEILRQSTQSMAVSTGSISLNVWTHVGMSMDASGNWALYINGVQDSSGTTAGAFVGAATALYLGSMVFGENFIGPIDVLTLWTRILSKQEFSQLYSDPLGLLQKPYLRLRSGIAASGVGISLLNSGNHPGKSPGNAGLGASGRFMMNWWPYSPPAQNVFDPALMFAMDHQRDIIISLPQVVASGMTPPDTLPN